MEVFLLWGENNKIVLINSTYYPYNLRRVSSGTNPSRGIGRPRVRSSWSRPYNTS